MSIATAVPATTDRTVQPQVATTARSQRIASLDGLRAAAVTLVLLYHIQEIVHIRILPALGINRIANSGWVGVDLFYVLSGFFIGSAVLRPATWHPLAFLKRRARRIIPAYYVSILIIIVLVNSYFIASTNGITHVLMHLLLVHSFSPDYSGSINGVYWTLGIEWWFYVLMMLSAPLLRSQRWFGPTVIAFVLIACSWRAGVWLVTPPTDGFRRYFLAAVQLPGTLDEFAVGIAVAHWALSPHNPVPARRALLNRMLRLGLAVAVTGWSFWMLLQHGGDYWINPFMIIFWRTCVAAGFGVLIMSFLDAGAAWGRLLARCGISYIGMISYSIYLFHLPILLSMQNSRPASNISSSSNTVFVLIYVAATLVVASCSFYLVESRWMRS